MSFQKFFSEEFVNKFQKNKLCYSAVVLDRASHVKLIKDPEISKSINPNFKIFAHHMTIKMGGLEGTAHEYRLGRTESLHVTHIGVTEDHKVLAVRVNGVSDNPTPHITVAVDTKNGGKPRQSNTITEWVPLKKSVILSGKVEEVCV